MSRARFNNYSKRSMTARGGATAVVVDVAAPISFIQRCFHLNKFERGSVPLFKNGKHTQLKIKQNIKNLKCTLK